MARVALWGGAKLSRLRCLRAGRLVPPRLAHPLPEPAAWGTAACPRSRQPQQQHSRRVHAAVAQPSPAAPAPAPPDDGAPHVPVLLEEVLSFFQGRPLEVYVDGTLGAGGHATHLLRQHPELRTLVGFDLDPAAHAIAAARLAAAGASVARLAHGPGGALSAQDGGNGGAPDPAVAGAGRPQPQAVIVHSNFGALREVLGQLPGGSLVGRVDGLLLDLGISSMQVDTSERGFSFMRDGPLDMRMDPGAALSAEELVNTWPEEELGRVFREFGEERHWRGIARRVAAVRAAAPITTTAQLAAAVGSPGGGGRRGGRGEGGRGKHPATRVFQAIRIAVNGELASIAAAVPDAIDCLAPGGRLAVITFHSLEDRIVKWAFRRAAGMAPSDEPLPVYCLPPGAAAEAAAAAPPLSAGRGGGGPARRRAEQRAQAVRLRQQWEVEQEEQPARVRLLTRRPVGPSEEEERANPRSRSAKLRVVEKL
eukprot:scaffold14.g1107.t1